MIASQGPGFIDNLRFIDNYREFNFNDKNYFIILESTKSFAPKHTSVYFFLKNSAWNTFNPFAGFKLKTEELTDEFLASGLGDSVHCRLRAPS